MQTIQIITSYSIYNEPVIRNRLEPIIEALLSKKYKVKLISNDEKKLLYSNKNFSHILVPLNFKSRKNFILRSLFEIILSLKLIKNSQQADGDYIFITIPSVFLLFFLFKFKRKKLHLDIRDLVWEYLFKNKVILRLIKFLIKINFKFLRSISYTNKLEYKNLLQYKFDKKKMFHISNGVSEKKFKNLEKVKISKSKNPTVSYIGNVGFAQNLKVLVSVAKLMPEIKFNIVGDGIELNSLIEIAKKNNIKNIKFTGRVKWIGVLDVYNKSDILFLQLDPRFKTAFPSKLYEYFSSGKFIIFSGNNNLIKNFLNFENINFVEYKNIKSIIKIIKKHTQSKKFRYISKKNRKLINKYFIRENLITNFVNSI